VPEEVARGAGEVALGAGAVAEEEAAGETEVIFSISLSSNLKIKLTRTH